MISAERILEEFRARGWVFRVHEIVDDLMVEIESELPHGELAGLARYVTRRHLSRRVSRMAGRWVAGEPRTVAVDSTHLRKPLWACGEAELRWVMAQREARIMAAYRRYLYAVEQARALGAL